MLALAGLLATIIAFAAPPAAAEPAPTPPVGDTGPVDWGDPTPAPVRHAPSFAGKVYPAATQAARDWAYARLGARQWGCLDRLWQSESGWRVKAGHPSRAYGIPQAYPGSKMASAGADWRTSAMTQVRWGLSYIRARFGSACNAWAHKQRWGWY